MNRSGARAVLMAASLVLAVGLILAPASRAMAAITVNWAGTGETGEYHWNVAGNWSPVGLPANGDTVYIDKSTNITVPQTILYDNANQSAVFANLRINSSYGYTLRMAGNDPRTLRATYEVIGLNALGTLTQEAGSNLVGNTLYLGNDVGSNGTYNLVQSGASLAALSATGNEFVGFYGTGTFVHSGGTNTANALELGYSASANGTYTLSQADASIPSILNPYYEYVGVNGTGAFSQTGGTNTVVRDAAKNAFTGYLYLGSTTGGNGTYNLSGGSLSAHNFVIGGDGGTGTFNQSGGSAAFSNVLYLGSSLNSHSAYALSGGSLSGAYGYVGYLGKGTFTQTGGAFALSPSLYLGVMASGEGTYNLAQADSAVPATLSANFELIGNDGTGTFNHTGGINTTNQVLYLGFSATGKGTYNLSQADPAIASTLTTFYGHVGYSGTGTFSQSGGNFTLAVDPSKEQSGTLYLGTNTTGSGTYTLSGGSLSANRVLVGFDGTGIFNQTGGGNSVADFLVVGDNNDKATGAYNLSAGVLHTSGQEYIGWKGTGTFTQSGGEHTVGDYISLGDQSTGKGTYTLSAGSLAVKDLYVGYEGTGTFNQSGGTHAVSGTMTIASEKGSTGSYAMSGGSLTAGSIVNNGTFGYSGGTVAVTSADGFTNSGAMNVTRKPVGDQGAKVLTGNLVNTGTIKVTGTDFRVTGTLTNNGAFISDPATTTVASLVIGTTGYLQGGAGDKWYIQNSFKSQSIKNLLWSTAESFLGFSGATAHDLYLTGQDKGAVLAGYTNNFAWGALDIGTGSLNLFDGNTGNSGTALYLASLLGANVSGTTVTNIHGQNGFTIYYQPTAADNAYLGGQSYNLAGGGQLRPIGAVPIPGAVWLLGSGLVGLLGLRKRIWS